MEDQLGWRPLHRAVSGGLALVTAGAWPTSGPEAISSELALWMALVEAGCEVDLENVRSIMPEDPDADTTFASAQDYAAKLGFELACVSKEMQKGRAPFEPSCEEEEEDEFELVRRVRAQSPTQE